MTTLPGKRLSTSLEDYLEAIAQLERENRVARVRDIARLLSVRMPSVTGALKSLKEKGLVNYERNSFISLTRQGRGLARGVQERHDALRRFLEAVLELPGEAAEAQACRMEHAVTAETTRRLSRLTGFFQSEVIGKGVVSPGGWSALLGGGARDVEERPDGSSR